MECEKCPIQEECKRMKEGVKNTKWVKAFKEMEEEFCPLAFASARFINDVKIFG